MKDNKEDKNLKSLQNKKNKDYSDNNEALMKQMMSDELKNKLSEKIAKNDITLINAIKAMISDK